MDATRKVPELSLMSFVNGTTNDKTAFVNNLFRGLKDYGFIVLVDHPVDHKLTGRAYDMIHEFFQMPLETKQKYNCKAGGGQRGYTAFGVEHARNSKFPDLKEFWHVGRESLVDEARFGKYFPENIWPSEIPEFKDTFLKLYNGLDTTSGLLLDALGMALDVPQSFFRNMLQDGNSILRPIHYPPLATGAPKNAVRSAAHEDINLITVMVGATTSGLELLDRDGKWLPISTTDQQLVVDSGDMLHRLTNDVIPATTHRVVNPDDATSARYSMPFFTHPNPDTLLSCIPSCLGTGSKYPAINSHEWLMKRLEEIGLMKKAY
ncbi:MAG TPA: 2-oxoglutarate and iron-dependent oxygenase domain-containing protein [Bacteriovoracaceae bacterium]|nr:2-oxoglutarate and iron-dependent oxygenase domain-containing protein [Bacteriovoracaceae bacterium]